MYPTHVKKADKMKKEWKGGKDLAFMKEEEFTMFTKCFS
jgi:IS4 transposase